jgi:hypothetical protein
VSAGFDLPGGESTAALLRRVEQERDEARLLLDQYKEAHRSSVEDYNRVAPALERCMDRWETARAERDQALAELRLLIEALEASSYVVDQLWKAAELARAELASARQELDAIRDEALAKRDQAIENSEYWMRIAQAARAELESARQELDALRRKETT